jgi:hypothetical protein
VRFRHNSFALLSYLSRSSLSLDIDVIRSFSGIPEKEFEKHVSAVDAFSGRVPNIGFKLDNYDKVKILRSG